MPQACVQLRMSEGSITINASFFEGVNSTTTFEGSDCYLKLIEFLRESFPNQVIQASVIVSSLDSSS